MAYPNNTSPASGAEPVTDPNDAGAIPPTRGILVGVSGNLHVLMANGDEVTFVGLAAGIAHPLQVVRVYDDGTTADNIVALY